MLAACTLLTLAAVARAAGDAPAPVSGSAMPEPASRGGVEVDHLGWLTLHGTSNLHDFHATTEDVHASLDVRRQEGATIPPNPETDCAAALRALAVRRLHLEFPLVSFHSGIPGLDPNLRHVLRAKEFPAITFDLDGFEVEGGASTDGTATVLAKGRLEVAGKVQAVQLTVSVRGVGNELHLTGRCDLLMTQFGITPPTALLGTLKTSDQIQIEYGLAVRLTPEVLASLGVLPPSAGPVRQ